MPESDPASARIRWAKASPTARTARNLVEPADPAREQVQAQPDKARRINIFEGIAAIKREMVAARVERKRHVVDAAQGQLAALGRAAHPEGKLRLASRKVQTLARREALARLLVSIAAVKKCRRSVTEPGLI